MSDDILKKYVCLNAFNYLEIHKKDVYHCCPSWLNTPVGLTDKLDEVVDGEISKKIQESILDGSYSYCSKSNCTYLSELYYNNRPIDIFVEKTHFLNNYDRGIRRISLCFDSSCNLACPSCRKDFMIEDKESSLEIKKIMDNIQKIFGKDVKELSISGTSDPFVSKTYREFLINFDKKYFPKLMSIYLQTNGHLLNENMWNKISKSNKLIKNIGVSIDSSCENTYNKLRKGGSWKNLLKNLKFISTLKCKKTYSFVVQKDNYKEMFDFYNMINELNDSHNYIIYYARINNWGTFTDEEFKQIDICNEEHPNFDDFLIELEKIAYKHHVQSNINDIITKHIPKKKKNIL